MREDFNYTALKLCGLLGLVYVIQHTTGFDPGFNASTSPIWKFFTSIFGHSGPEHLLNNLFFLGMFGTVYELITDSHTFILTFVVAGIFANISAFIFYPSSAIIGASGAAIGVLAALAVYRPNQIGLALGVPAPMWAVLTVYILINLAGLSATNGVAYEAHLMGMIPGALIGLYLRDSTDREDDEKNAEAENWKKKIRDWEEKYML